ncbi:hypothetical protein BD324DRAFT_652932 [Kockovaella imperatae]|uniref:Uncharacterized protein n=1 Tax=Kockovaella imperatae TaxID=4999 RepID=A0A1Y1UAY3_9TREE|nr:hypothetical protein BD324DRAFT_652932 [Kockovaella imperatae]ORX34666.1 hypothetical protein BD324DRAFT_652932 [Kockovaella imperatae]
MASHFAERSSRLGGPSRHTTVDKTPIDMDMDVAWCLTCSKRTRDSRSPYCSDQCRVQDTESSSSAAPLKIASPTISSHIPLLLQSPTTSTVPLSPAGRNIPRQRSRSQGRRQTSRPPLTPLPPTSQEPVILSQGLADIDETVAGGRARDRRAFSFPAPFLSTSKSPRSSRQSQTMLPPFIRKPHPTSGGPSTNSPIQAPTPRSEKEAAAGGLKPPSRGRQSRSSGGDGTTPQCPESVFGSTSESDEDKEVAEPFSLSPFPRPVTVSTDPTSIPLSRSTTAKSWTRLKGTLGPTKKSSPDGRHDVIRTRRHDLPSSLSPTLRTSSQSPVAQLVASSASSRSRDDIISWAKQVIEPQGSQDESSEEDRGRSRTRHSPRVKMSSKKLDAHVEMEESTAAEHQDDTARGGTTPKSRSSIGSALAGLSIGGFGVGPIVKALSTIATPAPAAAAGVTAPIITASPLSPAARRLSAATHPASTGALGLQAFPSRAEVSRVAVVTTAAVSQTASGPHRHIPPPTSSLNYDSDMPLHFGGGTPTLSTISISEAIDPSISDHHDHIEVVTDLTDDCVSVSSYARRPPSSGSRQGSKKSAIGILKPGGGSGAKTGNRTPLPLRPIASTANAIWNLSSYLRSITPFSIASAIAPYGPFSPSDEVVPSSPGTQRSNIADPSSPAAAIRSNLKVSHRPTPEPVPTSRMASPDHVETPAQLVRSLPMDIALSLKAGALEANQERMREREAREWLSRSITGRRQTRSGGRSQSQSRRSDSRSRARSRSPARSSSARRAAPGLLLAADETDVESDARRGHVAYDADESDGEEAPRRGRSRRGKAIGPGEVTRGRGRSGIQA